MRIETGEVMPERSPETEAEERIEAARKSSARELDLSGLDLTALPEAIGNLTALQQLDLGGNQLTALPEAIGNLTALFSLNAAYNQLTALPEAIGNLTAQKPST